MSKNKQLNFYNAFYEWAQYFRRMDAYIDPGDYTITVDADNEGNEYYVFDLDALVSLICLGYVPNDSRLKIDKSSGDYHVSHAFHKEFKDTACKHTEQMLLKKVTTSYTAVRTVQDATYVVFPNKETGRMDEVRHETAYIILAAYFSDKFPLDVKDNWALKDKSRVVKFYVSVRDAMLSFLQTGIKTQIEY